MRHLHYVIGPSRPTGAFINLPRTPLTLSFIAARHPGGVVEDSSIPCESPVGNLAKEC